VGSAGFALHEHHEHHEKKDAKKQANESQWEAS
jgi:hypothetical protein